MHAHHVLIIVILLSVFFTYLIILSHHNKKKKFVVFFHKKCAVLPVKPKKKHICLFLSGVSIKIYLFITLYKIAASKDKYGISEI